MKRYGFSDLITDKEPSKYVTVRDDDGNDIGEVECYYIEDEEDEEF